MSITDKLLSSAEQNAIKSQFTADVFKMLQKKPDFTVSEIVGATWPQPYDLVYFRWYDEAQNEWRNYNVARTQLGRILKGFIPHVEKELGIAIKHRSIERKGHGVTEYYVESEKPVFSLD
jgi:hypothetical protein